MQKSIRKNWLIYLMHYKVNNMFNYHREILGNIIIYKRDVICNYYHF